MKTKYCVVCGIGEELQNHHFIPISLGGKDEDNNILTLCNLHHNFIHKMEAKLNHNQIIKDQKQKRIKEGLYIGGDLPFGYKKEKVIGIYHPRKYGKISCLWKLGFDYESVKYKILCDVMLLYRYHTMSFTKLSTHVFEKYNYKINPSQLFKIRKRELKNNFVYWSENGHIKNLDLKK